jgi:hypothetical protein
MPLTSPVNNHSKIDDDLEIEAIVEKSAKLLVEDRFSPVTTHVLVENASSGQNKSESDESSESVSSDEEFYVEKYIIFVLK